MRTPWIPLPLLGLLLAGCSKPAPPPPPEPRPVAAPAAPLGTGHLTGHVRFFGKAPADAERPSKLAFPECSRFGPADSSLKLSPAGGVAEAFVWIKAGLAQSPGTTAAAPTTPVVLDQDGCEFKPRVFGIQVGQPLEIHNSDAFLHNTHAFAGGFNVPLPSKGAKVTRTFPHAEVPAVIGCDVHGWMRSYAGVVNHPFYAVTSADGAFDIGGLPAGHYTLEVWQERLGREDVEIDLTEGGTRTVELARKDGDWAPVIQ